AGIYETRSRMLRDGGHGEEARNSMARCVALRREVLRREPESAETKFALASALARLGNHLNAQNRKTDAVAPLREGLRLIDELPDPLRRRAQVRNAEAFAAGDLADVLLVAGGQDDEAGELYRRAIGLHRGLDEKEQTSETLHALGHLGVNYSVLLTRRKQYAQAEAAVNEALPPLERLGGVGSRAAPPAGAP